VRVLLSREDVVRMGPKRPPIAAGINRNGTGVVRVAKTPGIRERIAAMSSALTVEEIEVNGPPTSCAPRGAGWAEAAVLLGAVSGDPVVHAPNGARAEADLREDGSLLVRVACGQPLDEVVLRSYCIGAAHMGLGWVRSEGIGVDDDGVPQDLTIRSFGILRARDMPAVEVDIDDDGGPPVNGSDAAFAAVALAAWRVEGLTQDWPTQRRSNK
jgi:CO/xanthine dehydrogenase Mo-binding subunit